MNVTALMDTLDVSGPARQLVALIPEMSRRGVHIRPLLFEPANARDNPFSRLLLHSGVSHDIVRYERRFDRALLTETRKLITAARPDIVQTHSYRPTTIVSILRKRGLAIPWVAFFHGATAENAKVRMYHALDKVLMRLADRIVVVAPHQASRVAGRGSCVRVIHNAVLPGVAPPPQEDGRTLDGTLPRSSDTKIAVVGRLSHEKGVDVFLRAGSRMSKPFVAAVVGTGPAREALIALTSKLGLSERVVFPGRLTEIQLVYRWCDLVVLPSRSEGMPNVMLEAIYYGKRLVATDVGNVREVMGATPLGIVVPPRSPKHLAAAIETCAARIEHPDFETHRRRVLEAFSLPARADAHLALYRDVVRTQTPLPA